MSFEQNLSQSSSSSNLQQDEHLQSNDSENVSNTDEISTSEDGKKHSSFGKIGHKLKRLFTHNHNDNDNESKDHIIEEQRDINNNNNESNIQNRRINQNNIEQERQSEIKQQSSSSSNKNTNAAKMMGGDRTSRNIQLLGKLTKKENRHSIGPTTQQVNKSTNKNNNSSSNNNNNNNNNGQWLKRKSIEPNLQQQEYQRKINMQKVKEEEKKLISKQTIEKIQEEQENIQNNKVIDNNEDDKLFEEEFDPNKIRAMTSQNKELENYFNDDNKQDYDYNEQERHQHQNNENEIVEENNENSDKKTIESSSNSQNEIGEREEKEERRERRERGLHGSSLKQNLNNNDNELTKKKKRVTYRLNNEKFVVYDYYQITKVLGQGAYAVVAEAVDKRNGQKVAIKKNRGVFSSLSNSKRILREIKLLLHFGHENVISLISVIPPELHEREDFEEAYLVMPRMETTLSRVIRSKQALTERHRQYFIYQLLCGLRYIHSAGVLHRDLKPENILINGGDCKLKITDFGLSRGVLKENDQKLTEYVVTRWYRGPEVMCSSRRYDEGVDVWSVGCIMTELYLRKPFLPGSNHIEQLKLIFHYLGTPEDLEWIKTPDAKQWVSQMPKKPPKNFQQIMPGASDVAIDLMLAMLTVDPRKRISVQNALNHSWLKGLKRDGDDRTCEKFDLSFEFEASINTVFGVRHIMYEELKQFEKNRLKKLNEKKKKKKIITNDAC